MKKFIPQVKNWRDLMLIIYAWLILMVYALAYIDFSDYEARKRFYVITVAEVLLIAVIYICPKIMRFAENLSIQPEASSNRTKFFLKTWLIFFAAFLAMYIIFYPGGFSADSIGQYSQALKLENYNDWHPVLHTLFAFTLPLRLSGGWIGSIVLFQIFVFSLAMAFMLLTVYDFSNKVYTRAVMLYMLLSPAVLGISICMYKDTSFAVTAMLAMTFAARVHFTNGKFLNSAKNTICFVAVLVLTTIFRHNAILFTFPLLIAVMLYAGTKQKVLMLVLFLALIFLIRGPLYSSLNVEAPGYRKYETLGAAMSIITTAAEETPEVLDSDIVEFASEMTPDKVEEAGYAKMLGMVWRCLKQSPFVTLKVFCLYEGRAMGIAGVFSEGTAPYIVENNYGVEFRGLYALSRLFYFYSYGSMMTLKHIFWHPGIISLAVIILILAKLTQDFRRLCLVMPVLIYNYGTMILSRSNEFRFYAYGFLVMPLIMIIALRYNDSKNFNEGN